MGSPPWPCATRERSDQDIDLQAEGACYRALDLCADRAGLALGAVEHDVAALNVRGTAEWPIDSEHFAQVGHGKLVVAADIHGAEQGDVRRHILILPRRAAPTRQDDAMTSVIADPLAVARSLSPLVEQEAASAERAGRCPTRSSMIPWMGLFALQIPRALGGFESGCETSLAVYEEVCRADGSAGWTLLATLRHRRSRPPTRVTTR